jgi:hypothetical protein
MRTLHRKKSRKISSPRFQKQGKMSCDIAIDSADCTYQASWYAMTLPQNKMATFNSVELLEVILPNTLYIVQTGVNDKLDYSTGGGLNPPIQTIAIPAGAYSINTLITYISGQLSGLTITYNTAQFTVTFTNGGGFNVYFGTGPNAATSCAALLGFAKQDVGGVFATGTSVANVFQPLSLLLRVQGINSQNVLTSGGQSGTFRVPLAATSGQVLRLDRNMLYDQVIQLPIASKNQFVFQLAYNNGAAVNLNGANFQIVLRVKNSTGQVLS